jgi:very-short-patch-repair endonuclease
VSERRLTPKARQLRQQTTDVERLLWARLRDRQLEGAKFIRQFPIGNAIADFTCRRAKLVIELDGGQHAETIDADRLRTKMIESFGYTVIRFWNNDVLENMEGVLEKIIEHLRVARNS